MAWKGPRDPKTLLTCKIHTDKSYCPTLGPFWYPRGPKRARFGPKSPFGGPGGPWAALGGLISAQLPLDGVTGLDSWLPHTLTWYDGFLLRPRAQKSLFWPKMPLFGSLMGSQQVQSPPSKRILLAGMLNEPWHIGPTFQPQGPQKGYLAPNPSVLWPHWGPNFISVGL